MDFMNAVQSQLNSEKTFTTNGAVAYATSGKKLLDFNFSVTALRNKDEDEIQTEFSKAFFENPLVAVRYLFWLRDCRGGNGERKIFRACLSWLGENKPEIARAVEKLVPEYGRWDDLWCLLDTELKHSVVALVKEQLAADLLGLAQNKPISLLAKWLKSENCSSAESKRIAGIIRKNLGYSPKEYRQILSRLRSYIDVVERKMAAKEWGEIKYETVPSQANLRYANAFLKNDEDRRKEYLASLVKGETKINASVLFPHEVVNKYITDGYREAVKDYDETLEQLWKNLPDVTIDNAIVVRDGSGSMRWGGNGNVTPLTVATALAVYMSEHNGGVFKDKFITFSARPKLIDLSNCTSLRDKLVRTYEEDECTNTNVEATMRLILETAKTNHCSQEDLPKRVIICSDMQFDGATDQRVDRSLFDGIASEFEAAGYQMPKICFWNLAADISGTVPMKENALGVVLASGFSVQILKMFMSGETDPYKVLLETINQERYNPVEEAVKNLM